MSHFALVSPLPPKAKLAHFRVRIRSYIKTKNWQGEAKGLGKGWRDSELKTQMNVLPDLTSQMRKIKRLNKVRYKPQGFEVNHRGSMGIYT